MSEKRKIYSVSEVNRAARMALEHGVGEVWVEGEISRLTRHSSGHWYFTLKDENAAVSCAMFKQSNLSVPFEPKDGIKVRVLGRASLYEANGRYQLIVQSMEEAGKGSLQEQFEKLKVQLAGEGLFDADRKKPLPMLPQKIGVVTSPTGAAIRDIINVLSRRFPNIEILIAPVTVQGEGSAPRIARAIAYLNTREDVDIIIAGRGGGSLEDLWAFNEEPVARAIAESEIPVISAVGHEIDFTIADFVADVRAPTPSAAAELAVPVQSELQEQIVRLSGRLKGTLHNQATILQERIPGLQRQLSQYLQNAVQQKQQRVDEATLRLSHELKNSVTALKQQLPALQQRMAHRLQTNTAMSEQRLKRLSVQLRALNPLGVLDRGYSLTENENGDVIRNVDDVKKGDQITTRLAEGTIRSEVKET